MMRVNLQILEIVGISLAIGIAGHHLITKGHQPASSMNVLSSVTTQTLIAQRLEDEPQGFNTLTFLGRAGGLQLPESLINQLGYDPSRQWEEGQSLADILRLGDVEELIPLREWTLEQILSQANLPPEQVTLADLALLERVTFQELRSLLPNLSSLPLSSLPPVSDALTLEGIEIDSATLFGELGPDLLSFSLDNILLERYPLSSLPGLGTTPLSSFTGWQDIPLSGIPGLADLPLVPSLLGGFNNSRVDIVFGTTEEQRANTISGSNGEGFSVPCDLECAHLELGEPYLGKQLISGKYQEVRGGHGLLGEVNDGMEPTGIHPFGLAFKMVLWETDEASGTAELVLFFRICADGLVDLGCTPYFIGPVPWRVIAEEDFMSV